MAIISVRKPSLLTDLGQGVNKLVRSSRSIADLRSRKMFDMISVKNLIPLSAGRKEISFRNKIILRALIKWKEVFSPLKFGRTTPKSLSVNTVKKNDLFSLTPSETPQEYHSFFAGMLDGFVLHEVLHDEQGKCIDLRVLASNPVFKKITTRQTEDISGQTLSSLLPEIDPFLIHALGRVAETGEALRLERTFQGGLKHFEIQAFSGKRGQVACLFKDVTIQKEEEFRLKQAENHFETLVRNLGDVVVCYGKDRRRNFVSPHYEKLTGVPRHFILGKKLDDEENPICMGKELHHALEETFTKARQVSCLYTHQHPSKGLRFIEVSFFPILDKEEVCGAISCSRDVTESLSDTQKNEMSVSVYRQKVLVVDDEEGIRFVLSHFLTSLGMDVEDVTSGHEALELMQGKNFDLIFTDISMPGMTGQEFVLQAKTKFPNLKTPFVCLSGLSRVEGEDSLFEAGISKPFDFEQLSDLIQKFIKKV